MTIVVTREIRLPRMEVGQVLTELCRAQAAEEAVKTTDKEVGILLFWWLLSLCNKRGRGRHRGSFVRDWLTWRWLERGWGRVGIWSQKR